MKFGYKEKPSYKHQMRGRRMRRRPMRIHPFYRRRRILRPFWRPLSWGMFTLLLLGGTMYKLQNDDVDRIERYTSRRAEDLTEEELVAAMRKLGIKRLELTEEDRRKLESSE